MTRGAAASARIGVGMLAVACAFAAAPVVSSAGAVQVVVRTTQPIEDLAGAGDRVAWMQSGLCGSDVWKLNLSVGRPIRLTRCSSPPQGFGPLHLALATAMWSIPFASTSGTETDATLRAAGRFGQARTIARFTAFGCGSGICGPGVSGLHILGPTAAGGGELVYGVTIVGAGSNCSNGFCNEIATGGTVREAPATAGKPVSVPGAPAAAMLVSAAGRIADVPVVIGADLGQVSHTVDVINATTGTAAATIPIAGDIHAIALSRSKLAVLVRSAAGVARIRRYTPRGTLLGVTRLQTQIPVSDDLHIIGSTVVFETRRGIFAMYAATGRYRRVRLTRRAILGVAVADGPRVVWFEKPASTSGKILSTALP